MIYSLRTIDGNKGSAEGTLKTLNDESEAEFKKRYSKKHLS